MRLHRVVLYSPVQLNTTWRQPDVSFVYETSPTFRFGGGEGKENCHLLTMPLLTRGAWEKVGSVYTLSEFSFPVISAPTEQLHTDMN